MFGNIRNISYIYSIISYKLKQTNKMANTTKISKQAILDFINERIDAREVSKDFIKETEAGYRYMIMNESAITAFKSIRTLIQEGKFDVDLIAELPENPNNFDETFSHLLNK